MKFIAVALAVVSIIASLTLIEGKKCWKVSDAPDTTPGSKCPPNTEELNSAFTKVMDDIEGSPDEAAISFATLKANYLGRAVNYDNTWTNIGVMRDGHNGQIRELLDEFAIIVAASVGVTDSSAYRIVYGTGIPDELRPCVSDMLNAAVDATKIAEDKVSDQASALRDFIDEVCPDMDEDTDSAFADTLSRMEALVEPAKADLELIKEAFAGGSIDNVEAADQARKKSDDYRVQVFAIRGEFAVKMAEYVGVHGAFASDIIYGDSVTGRIWSCISDRLGQAKTKSRVVFNGIEDAYDEFIDTLDVPEPDCPVMDESTTGAFTTTENNINEALNSAKFDFESIRASFNEGNIDAESAIDSVRTARNGFRTSLKREEQEYAMVLAGYLGITVESPYDVISAPGVPSVLWPCVSSQLKAIGELRTTISDQVWDEAQTHIDFYKSQ